MAEIVAERVRARIVIQSDPNIVVETPYVTAFSINRQRGQIISTFSASIEVPVTDLPNATSLTGQGIEIYAGLRGNLRKLFTGEIKSLRVNPSWDKPEYLVLDLSGEDILARLENTKYSRRIPWSTGGVWARIIKINSTKGRKKTRILDTKITSPKSVVINTSPDLSDHEHDRIIYARDLSRIDPYAKIKDPEADTSSTRKEFEFQIEYTTQGV